MIKLALAYDGSLAIKSYTIKFLCETPLSAPNQTDTAPHKKHFAYNKLLFLHIVSSVACQKWPPPHPPHLLRQTTPLTLCSTGLILSAFLLSALLFPLESYQTIVGT